MPASSSGIPTSPLSASGPRIIAEPVLLTTDATGSSHSKDAAFADVLLSPLRLLRVYSANLQQDYPVDQFQVIGRRLMARSHEGLPVFSHELLYPRQKSDHAYGHYRDGKRFVRYSEGHYFHGVQLCIDYETDGRWTGPIPIDESNRLPRLMHRLRSGEPVTVALLGDSISTGSNTSGDSGVPPFQPAWQHLFVRQLNQRFSSPVSLLNFARGGMTAHWGIDQTDDIASHRPHLVILAFGMNDISEQRLVATFLDDLRSIMNRIRCLSPDSEFLLVSGMNPNPDWHLAFPKQRQSAHEGLQYLAKETPHCACCDVRSSWNYLVTQKGFWSLTGNGINHPNDYGHRLYTHCLLACLGLSSTTP